MTAKRLPTRTLTRADCPWCQQGYPRMLSPDGYGRMVHEGLNIGMKCYAGVRRHWPGPADRRTKHKKKTA